MTLGDDTILCFGSVVLGHVALLDGLHLIEMQLCQSFEVEIED